MEGYREILGIDVSTAEDGAGWLTFWRSLTRPRDLRGTTGHLRRPRRSGAAIGATLPGAAWQHCRTHYTTNLMAITLKASWRVGTHPVAFGVRSVRQGNGCRAIRSDHRRAG